MAREVAKKPQWYPKQVEAWVFGGSLVLLAGIYIALALDLASFRTFWSPDSGVRFWMIRNWVEHGNLIYLPYDAEKLDPDLRLHPLSAGYPGYVAHLEKGICTIYPPLFPFLCGIFYRLLGFPGLTVIPLLSGLGTVVLVTATARRMRLSEWPLLPLITGLATPVMIYSVVFWDHATYMFLAALAAYLLYDALELEKPWSAAWSGAVLGLGVWFHEFFGGLLIALILGALISPRGAAPRKLVWPLLGGFLALVAAWVLCNLWLYGVAAGPHVMGANDPRQPKFARRLLTVEWMFLQAAQQLIGKDPWAELLLYLLLVLVFCQMAGPKTARWVPLLLLGYLGGILATSPESWSNGFLTATPLLVLSLSGRWYESYLRQGENPANLAETWFCRSAFLFAGVVLITPLGGGIGWGNRAMLTALPLFLLVAASVVDRCRRQGSLFHRRALELAVVAVVVTSGSFQAYGWQELRQRLPEERKYHELLAPLKEELVATDKWLLWPFAAAGPLPRLPFTIRNRAVDREAFGAVVAGLGVEQFTYLASEDAAMALQVALQSAGSSYTVEQRGVGHWEFRRRHSTRASTE